MYTSKEFRFFLILLAMMAIFIAAVIRGLFTSNNEVNSPEIMQEESNANPTSDLLDIDQSFYEIDQSVFVDAPKANVSVVVDQDGITAKSYIVGDIETGEVHLQSKSDLTLPIASMSKLMTSFVAKRVLTSTTTIEITPENTKVFPDQSKLEAGEVFTFEEMLYPLLLNSSNVAAEAIATSYGRTRFLELMSSYAWEIGLPTSYFTDPSGLSPNNRASAEGFFELVRYINRTDPNFFDVTKVVNIEVATTTTHGYHNFVNIHPFVKDARFIGGKTGRTKEAGDTMLTILNIDGRQIAFIVLGSAYDKRKADTDLLVKKYLESRTIGL